MLRKHRSTAWNRRAFRERRRIVCGSWESDGGCVSPGPETVKAKAELRMRSQVLFPFCLPQPLGRSHASVSQQGSRSSVREWENFSCTEKFLVHMCSALLAHSRFSEGKKLSGKQNTNMCAERIFTLREFRGQLDEGYFGFLWAHWMKCWRINIAEHSSRLFLLLHLNVQLELIAVVLAKRTWTFLPKGKNVFSIID